MGHTQALNLLVSSCVCLWRPNVWQFSLTHVSPCKPHHLESDGFIHRQHRRMGSQGSWDQIGKVKEMQGHGLDTNWYVLSSKIWNHHNFQMEFLKAISSLLFIIHQNLTIMIWWNSDESSWHCPPVTCSVLFIFQPCYKPTRHHRNKENHEFKRSGWCPPVAQARDHFFFDWFLFLV